jgi:hypothetical protein
MARIAKGSLKRNTWYSLCVKASLAKCYEFNVAIPRLSAAEGAFFAMSALRGICEDLIVLRFYRQTAFSGSRGSAPRAARSRDGKAHQAAGCFFFRSFRPQQPVLRLKDPDAPIASCLAAAQAVWRRHGWPNFKGKEMPPVREIAERQGSHTMNL